MLRRDRIVAALAALLLLAGMVSLSPDFGFTWDERFQQKYGEQIWDYYHGRLPRSSFDTDIGNQFLYGGLVEVASVAAQQVIDADIYVVRHMVNAVFGWVGIVYAGMLAGWAFGARAGWLAAILLTLSPRYLGDAMNNPKDAPFAALTMAALYYALTIDWRPPHLSWRRVLALTTAIALAINIRPLGLMLLLFSGAVVVLVGGAAAIWPLDGSAPSGRRAAGFLHAVVRLAIVAAVAIPAGTLAWPWAQASPWIRPVEAFLISTRVDWASGFDVLYDGAIVAAGTLPWHYVPWWLVMCLPPVVLVGVALSALVWRSSDPRARLAWLALAGFALAPVAGAIWRHATIYDGIRHLLFIVPPLTVLAAAGWSRALGLGGVPPAVAAGVLALGLAEPFMFQVRNHPNQIVYFSPLTGGPAAAFGRYDMDYWGNCVLQAVDWANGQALRLREPLGVSGNLVQAVEADVGRYRALWYARPGADSFQFDIRLLRGPGPVVRAFGARGDALHRVTMADGTPLCVVLPGPAFSRIRDRME